MAPPARRPRRPRVALGAGLGLSLCLGTWLLVTLVSVMRSHGEEPAGYALLPPGGPLRASGQRGAFRGEAAVARGEAALTRACGRRWASDGIAGDAGRGAARVVPLGSTLVARLAASVP